MIRLSKQIRAYVDDPESTGRLYYGEWGALRPDQRRLIRKLCDECDAFERDADHIAEQYEAKLREKDAEIERLTKERDLANAEREANVKGFTEELQNTIDRYKGVIRILEQDIATRDKLIESKVEAAYPEFMRDYKQLQEEYNDLRNEIIDEYVERCKRAFNFAETTTEKSLCDTLCKVAKNLKEAHK